MNPLINSFPLGALSLSKQSKQIICLYKDFGYVDVWRTLHLTDKEFTFFSNFYDCYTRIDYFFPPKQLIESVISGSFGNQVHKFIIRFTNSYHISLQIIGISLPLTSPLLLIDLCSGRPPKLMPSLG